MKALLRTLKSYDNEADDAQSQHTTTTHQSIEFAAPLCLSLSLRSPLRSK